MIEATNHNALFSSYTCAKISSLLKKPASGGIPAKDKEPIIIAKIKNIVGFQPAEGQFLARRRHLEALEATKRLLLTGENALNTNLSGELLAEDLRLAHQELTKITGEFSADDLLGVIFSSFCIGK